VSLEGAVARALADEPALPRDMRAWLTLTLADEPWPHILGDTIPRGGPSGVVWAEGREIAAWGEPDRVDMCFSIAKSALLTVAGIAWADGLLELDAPVEALDGSITWRHLLTQTSDWRGELFGLPWWADPQGRQRKGAPLEAPGTRFAYNDIRTNLLSLSLTTLLGRGLDEVLRDRVMAPMGAGDGWSWRGLHGMRTAEGHAVVTGGSHWGGGLWMSARQLAVYGLLHLRDGRFEGDELLPAEWCALQRTPTPARPAYGLMWWLRGRCFYAHGTGEQLVWCDPDRDLVAVVRWSRDPFRIVEDTRP
jgi:CubicO group peptidase (beta-lactamase class C family)